MKRKHYFDFIEEKLNFLAFRTKQRAALNLLELNIHSETFFAELCNLVFDFSLINLNAFEQNTEGIDLLDKNNQIVVQVSSTCTKAKIESSLNKKIYKDYGGFRYIFLSISPDNTDSLKKSTFKNPYNLKFVPQNDIMNCNSLLQKINGLTNSQLEQVYEFIKKELGSDNDLARMDSNLAQIINILAEEKLDLKNNSPVSVPFDIEDKINFNNLVGVKEIIEDYIIYNNKLDELYTEFDKMGQNKSISVLQELKKQYIILKNTGKNSTEIFYGIMDNVIRTVRESRNYIKIPLEELDLCVIILVVDAFIRCKIFEKPKGI